MDMTSFNHRRATPNASTTFTSANKEDANLHAGRGPVPHPLRCSAGPIDRALLLASLLAQLSGASSLDRPSSPRFSVPRSILAIDHRNDTFLPHDRPAVAVTLTSQRTPQQKHSQGSEAAIHYAAEKVHAEPSQSQSSS